MRENAIALIRKAGVHGNVGYRRPTDSNVTRGVTFGPSVGLSPGRTNGWKYPVALTMFSEDLHGPNGQQFGSVRTRAILAGVGYGWHFERFSMGPQVEVGYAFTHGTLTEDPSRAFDAQGPVSMHVDNGWIVRPEFKLEYFISSKFTLRTSVDYIRLQPAIVVTTPAGVINDGWNMSNIHANVGVGFYPFRK